MSDAENDTTDTGSQGSSDSSSSGDESLHEAIKEAVEEHEDDGAAAMADHLRNRVEETEAEPEAPGDRED